MFSWSLFCLFVWIYNYFVDIFSFCDFLRIIIMMLLTIMSHFNNLCFLTNFSKFAFLCTFDLMNIFSFVFFLVVVFCFFTWWMFRKSSRYSLSFNMTKFVLSIVISRWDSRPVFLSQLLSRERDFLALVRRQLLRTWINEVHDMSFLDVNEEDTMMIYDLYVVEVSLCSIL